MSKLREYPCAIRNISYAETQKLIKYGKKLFPKIIFETESYYNGDFEERQLIIDPEDEGLLVVKFYAIILMSYLDGIRSKND